MVRKNRIVTLSQRRNQEMLGVVGNYQNHLRHQHTSIIVKQRFLFIRINYSMLNERMNQAFFQHVLQVSTQGYRAIWHY